MKIIDYFLLTLFEYNNLEKKEPTTAIGQNGSCSSKFLSQHKKLGTKKYQKLPMGLCNSPDMFQKKMNELFNCLEYVRVYIDDLLIISNWNLNKKVLSKLKAAGFKINAEKSFFARDNLEYLYFKIIRQGIMALSDKI